MLIISAGIAVTMTCWSFTDHSIANHTCCLFPQIGDIAEQMAVGASVVGVVAVLVGLNGSLRFDTPAG